MRVPAARRSLNNLLRMISYAPRFSQEAGEAIQKMADLIDDKLDEVHAEWEEIWRMAGEASRSADSACEASSCQA
jgi:hypothetical protein